MEIYKYKFDNSEVFSKLGTEVFTYGSLRIYKVAPLGMETNGN